MLDEDSSIFALCLFVLGLIFIFFMPGNRQTGLVRRDAMRPEWRPNTGGLIRSVTSVGNYDLVPHIRRPRPSDPVMRSNYYR